MFTGANNLQALKRNKQNQIEKRVDSNQTNARRQVRRNKKTRDHLAGRNHVVKTRKKNFRNDTKKAKRKKLSKKRNRSQNNKQASYSQMNHLRTVRKKSGKQGKQVNKEGKLKSKNELSKAKQPPTKKSSNSTNIKQTSTPLQYKRIIHNSFGRNKNYFTHKKKKTSAEDEDDEKMLDDDGNVVKRRGKRAATAKYDRLWDYGVIPYEIEANFSGAHKTLFIQAMKHWENHTCITFVERTATDASYILFTEKPCGKEQDPRPSPSGRIDKFGIVVHELGHVIGFWRKHTRPDRETHVQIVFKNILPGQEYNFNTLTHSEVNSLNEEYDYLSIMHYARNTFSKAVHLDTITPLVYQDIRPEIGQRIELSPGDIVQANKLYNCPKLIKCTECGDTFLEASGTFGYPWNAKRYMRFIDTNAVCAWRIAGSHGEKIVLNITSFDIPENPNCSTDVLEIRDGHWVKSPLMDRLCGLKLRLPYQLISSDSRMWIEYRRTLRSLHARGFTARYEAVCDGKIAKDSGLLTSPHYPDSYEINKKCTWHIVVPHGYTVALKFQSFEIEHHDKCVYDYVELRDGDVEMSPLIGRFCGHKLPQPVESSTNWLFVKFVSDSSVVKSGFAAHFTKEVDECATNDHGCEQICINTLGSYHCDCKLGYELHSDGRSCEQACGGILRTHSGSISSPSHPHFYPNNKTCEWEIIAHSGFQIVLFFDKFDLEGNNCCMMRDLQEDCEYDSLVVKSWNATNTATHGPFCGTTAPRNITSIAHMMRVVFKTDGTVQKTGFLARFETDKDECAISNGHCQQICINIIGSYKCQCKPGFVLHENEMDCKESDCKHELSGRDNFIKSPNYPDYYPQLADCTWLFRCLEGHRIKINFLDCDIEYHADCNNDYVDLFDGWNTTAPRITRFCGGRPPNPIEASGNVMFMRFVSDKSVFKKGFHANQETVCGGTFEATKKAQNLYSHAKYSGSNYEAMTRCQWQIVAEKHHRIRLKFLTFQLEEELVCKYDNVEIYDVDHEGTEQLIDTSCGSRIPPVIISHYNELLIKLFTDDAIDGKGFHATYEQIPHNPLHKSTWQKNIARSRRARRNQARKNRQQQRRKNLSNAIH
ncbi:hypothetical protein HELRODRAFT_191792 [Helobdella robusta]|uniref:Metalloendopeptidase n=1 Tax=Helobdella robusta TaxID=6412 RepID=T1FTB9_HELRO|nr:hypothetical protein HELRODRAFT_191792 [Helobdella robusta]ESO03888.1 hypothetical protein HELRODRAFT_191792 [Helobdella robusta]